MPFAPNQLTVREIMEMVFQNKWLFLLSTFLGVLIAVYVINVSEKWYASQADIEVIDRNTQEPLLSDLGVTTSVHQRFSSVYSRLTSLPRLENLAQRLQQHSLPYLPKDVESAGRELRGTISMGIRSGIIYVRAERRDPEEARVIVSYLSKDLQNELTEIRETQIDGAKDFLQDLLTQYATKLKDAEEYLRDFDKLNMITLNRNDPGIQMVAADLEGQTKTPKGLVDMYIALAHQQAEDDVELSALEAEFQQVLDQMAEEPAYRVETRKAGRTPEAQRLEAMLAQARADLAVLQHDNSPLHPEVVARKEDIARLRRQYDSINTTVVEESLETANPVLSDLRLKASELESKIRAIESRRDTRESQAERLKAQIAEIPDKELEKSRLQREHTVLSEMYDKLRRRYEDAKLTDQLERADRDTRFLLLNEASYDETYIRPKPNFILAMGVFLGAIAGVSLSFLRELTDTSFRNLDDASRFLDLPVLGVIPEVTDSPPRRRRRVSHQRSRTA